ncbi:hypothetical protein OQA88_5117 [Cercophora sp. LCS_1]
MSHRLHLHRPNFHPPPIFDQAMANPNQVPPAGVVQLYTTLVMFRASIPLGGLLFSIPSPTLWPAFWHLVLMPLTILEGVAAGYSRTTDLRKKRMWTITNVALYFASLAVLVVCFLPGRGPGGPPILMLVFPDILNLIATVASFFTLPMLRIKNWRALPSDDGLLVGDAVPVVAYHDEEEGEEEVGALADAFRAQQGAQSPDGDEQSG